MLTLTYVHNHYASLWASPKDLFLEFEFLSQWGVNIFMALDTVCQMALWKYYNSAPSQYSGKEWEFCESSAVAAELWRTMQSPRWWDCALLM